MVGTVLAVVALLIVVACGPGHIVVTRVPRKLTVVVHDPS